MDDSSIYFRLPKIEKEGFVVQHDELPYFYNQLHYHPEIQLISILEGTGDLFVGDSITPFEGGDLFLIGSNQSHLFNSDDKYFDDNFDGKSRSVSIFFNEKSLGKGFFDLAETTAIRSLIDRSDRCLQFQKEAAEYFGARLKGLLNITGFDRFLEILSMLLKKLTEIQQRKYVLTLHLC